MRAHLIAAIGEATSVVFAHVIVMLTIGLFIWAFLPTAPVN